MDEVPYTSIREIPLNDDLLLQHLAALISKYSWGEDYPISPLDDLRQSDFIVGSYKDTDLVGFSVVNRVASPDGKDNGELWFADTVVLPDHRRRGIYMDLYQARMNWIQNIPGRIFSCTDNQVIDMFFLSRGWEKIRETKNESGGDCRVYEFIR